MHSSHIDNPPSPAGWDISPGLRPRLDPLGDRRRCPLGKALGVADDYRVSLVKIDPGYPAAPNGHDYPELLFVLDESVQNPRTHEMRSRP